MRNSKSIFDKDASFTFGGKVYTIEKKVNEIVDVNGIIPSQFDNYLITSDNKEEYILKMAKNLSSRPGNFYDSEEDHLIEKEYSVLQKINQHPNTLQCLGKVIMLDKFQSGHCSLILKKLQYYSLEKYLDAKLNKLNMQALIELSISTVDTFLSFDYEDIFFNDELTLSNFGVDESERIIISSGFSFCKINSYDKNQEDKQSYIYKKNCAQIKCLVFSILTVNRELLKKYITPYNVQNQLEKIIQNSSIAKFLNQYPNCQSIYQDNDLMTLQDFLQYLKNLNRNPLQSSTYYNRQQTYQMEKIQKIPTQVYKMNLNTEKSEITIPDYKGTQIQIDTIAEEDGSESYQSQEKPFQVVKIKKFQNSMNSSNSSNISDSRMAALNDQNEMENQDIYLNKMNGNYKKQIVEIEMQNSNKNYDQIYQEAQNKVQKKKLSKQAVDSIFNEFQGRQSIQSQCSNFSNQSESFRTKADRLKDEEIEDIHQQIKTKQKLKGEYQDRKQQLQMAKQLEQKMKIQEIKSDEENQNSSRGSDPFQVQDSQRLKSGSLSDKLLFQIQESNSFISDTNVIRILLALLLVFIIGGIIFGAVFNFGVNTSNHSQTIVCLDQNCSLCAEFEDQCTSCKSGFYFDSFTQKCQPNCTTANCTVCITNYQVCEQCSSGYTLYQNTCLNSAQSCPISNCSSCKNLKCTQCKSGYRLYNQQCYKICSDPLCLSCPSSSNICTQCEPNFKVNASSNSCESI